MLRIAIALHNVEETIKADPFDLFNDKEWVIQHKSELLQKMQQGQKDEQYVQDFYEILKKADKFWKTASPEKVAMAADKYGMSLGKKDRWGRRFDHYGFYDPKSKHYGKTLKDVMETEVKEKVLDDDNLSVQFMFSNHPIIEGFSKLNELVEQPDGSFRALTEPEKAKLKKFPLRIIRNDDNVVNKIEQLTEYLHIKKIDHEYRILEFLIPRKFGVHTIEEDNIIFKELIDIDQVWIRDEYGTMYGYKIEKYYKRVKEFKDEFEAIKFTGKQIENID
ncbi:MAG: hypothetical protein ACOCVF_01350 [bacterium]